MIRVVIVDDHIVFREGLRLLLERADEIDVVGEAATTADAIDVVASTLPDVVLMDLSMPGEGGVAATAAINERHPGTAVLVLTMHSDEAHLHDALASGARGYILKDADPEAITRAVAAVKSGQVILDPGIAQQVIASNTTRAPERPFPTLTDREYNVLDRLARGLRNEAIAARMGISTKTVQNNVSSILLKLGATDRAQAVARARDAGLGTVRDP